MNKVYYAKNKEKLRVQSRRWYQEHKYELAERRYERNYPNTKNGQIESLTKENAILKQAFALCLREQYNLRKPQINWIMWKYYYKCSKEIER